MSNAYPTAPHRRIICASGFLEIFDFDRKSHYFYVVDRAFNISELNVLIEVVQVASLISETRTERFIDKIAALAGNHRAESLKKHRLFQYHQTQQ